MKRQVAMLASIVVISFLLGTSFNMNSIAGGGDSSPWNKVWTAISELRWRVDTIEQETRNVKTIRFCEPHEKMTDYALYEDVAIFVWTPSNSTNNAVLSINCYFQYRTEAGNQMRFRIVVNDEAGEGIGWYSSSIYKWFNIKQIRFDTINIFPNQDNYTLKFQLGSFYSGEPVYVKNINIILTAADGLPAYNP